MIDRSNKEIRLQLRAIHLRSYFSSTLKATSLHRQTMAVPPAPPPPPDSTTTNSPPSTSTASASSDMIKYLTAARLLMRGEADAVAAAPPLPLAGQNLNFRPVIGILSHPGDGASGRLNDTANVSYIAASYVKFVESAGARVIPLVYNEPWEVLHRKLNLVNGVIFTGGRIKRGPYFEVLGLIFKEVLRRNEGGDHFPLLAVCLGFELLTKIVSEDSMIVDRFNAKNQASTLQFMENIDINGTLFQRFPPALLKKLSTECLVMQNHKFGISPKMFQENKRLRSFFKILTTSADKDGEVYVSTVQARRYPVTAFQWHPEKNAFEWGLSGIPHSEDAVQVTQHVANFFVREARMSTNRPPAQKVLDNLIYNYSATYCGKAGRGFDEVYNFS